MRASQISAALFETEYESVRKVLLPEFYFLAYEFEADGHFYKFHAELSAHCLCHTRRHKRLYDGGVFRKFIFLFKARQNIVQKQNSYLISGKRFKLALAVFDGNAKPVAVGIGSENNGRAYLFCERNSERKRFLKFGVGNFHRRKFGVLFRLFFDNRGFYTYLFEDSRNGNISRTVHGCIDKFEILSARLYCAF